MSEAYCEVLEVPMIKPYCTDLYPHKTKKCSDTVLNTLQTDEISIKGLQLLYYLWKISLTAMSYPTIMICEMKKIPLQNVINY